MKMQLLARETYINVRFEYKSQGEALTILSVLKSLKHLTKGEPEIILGSSIYACVRCDVVDTIYYKLKLALEHTKHAVTEEIVTVNDEIKRLDR